MIYISFFHVLYQRISQQGYLAFDLQRASLQFICVLFSTKIDDNYRKLQPNGQY